MRIIFCDRELNEEHHLLQVSVHWPFGEAIAFFCTWKQIREEDWQFRGVRKEHTGYSLGASDLDDIYIIISPTDVTN
jgi:hypothetical protein